MSTDFAIICHKTRQKIWIGQGIAILTNFYSGDAEIMKNLKGFLNETMGESLEFVDNDNYLEYEEYQVKKEKQK